MNDVDRTTAVFEADRARLRAIARRLLGSEADADDAVQEAWIRLDRTDSDAVDNLHAWLTTVVTRVCLDRLRRRRTRREEPADTSDRVDSAAQPSDELDPAHETIVAESVGAALLVVLDRLAPAERVAFVLHDVFAIPFEQIAEILERTPDATRQLASRARRRVQGTEPTMGLDLVRQRQAVDAFLRAARNGDFEALVNLLDPDVVLRTDAAAQRMGSLRETHGAGNVAALVGGGAQAARVALVDGVAALVWAPGGRTRGVVEFTLSGDRIVAIDVTGDADRIGRLDIVPIEV
jgi:RNA polymerase sigma-70 factor (ECF subfamily)